MTAQPPRPYVRVFVRSWLFSALATTLTFIVVWLVLYPVWDFKGIASILLLAFLTIVTGMVPVILLLALGALVVRRYAPAVLASTLSGSVALMITGGWIATGGSAIVLGTFGLGTGSEFFKVVLLAGAVGGIVGGWIIARGMVQR